jgi:hypothetical protein
MRIGITIDFSIAFWANGMQQNIVFLYEILERAGHDCYYITDKEPVAGLSKQHKGMYLFDLLEDKSEKFDTIIAAGFGLTDEMYAQLKSRNKNTKIVAIHYGNKMYDDIHYSLQSVSNKRDPARTSEHYDAIWTSPHYNFAIPYLKEYYKTDNVFECPYIWDPFFIQEKLKSLKSKGLDPHFREEDVRKICIFEPNKSFSKNCILPLSICSRVESLFPGTLDSVNIYCTAQIRQNSFFEKLANIFPIVSDKKDFTYFNNRWSSFDALSRHGSTILSHQIGNELNYIYFEALYLNLPIIHNSSLLHDVGYYYPEHDIDMAAKQIKNATMNHASTINSYKGDAQRFLYQYSPMNPINISRYNDLLRNE